MKYEKIQTLWKRDADNKYCIMPGQYSKEEFSNIREWYATEKIDGMNIRIILTKGDLRYAGRTDEAVLPDELLNWLISNLHLPKMQIVFDMDKAKEVILYGEGYGPKIQKGGLYRDDQSFILFDILIDGMWLEGLYVSLLAKELGIDRAPVLRAGTIANLTDIIIEKQMSQIDGATRPIEGIVCRTRPLLLDRFGNRIVWKLKIKDYDQLERLKNE